jgi:uncharacterized cupin superfamily protein
MGVPEAKLRETEHGLVPEGEGWFVVNVRDARWKGREELGKFCAFEGEARFPEVGINVNVLEPGQPSCMYHGEDAQEAFLILSGECLLLVEGEERPLKAWDFVHLPAWTEHVLVGAGSEPCVFVAVGARRPGIGLIYPAAEVAARHGAAVAETTESNAEAYARFSPVLPRRAPEDLPEL